MIRGGSILLAPVTLLCVRRLCAIVSVEGLSMTPTLRPGARVLICRWPAALLRRGMIVAVRFPGYPPQQWADLALPPPDRHPEWVIKRIAACAGERAPARHSGERQVVPAGHVFVIGDGQHSLDSRDWGPLPVGDVLGVMILGLPAAE